MGASALRLERDIDRITAGWLADLATWTLDPDAGETGTCTLCLHYAERWQLDEVPHALLHLLTLPVEGAVVDYASESFGERRGAVSAGSLRNLASRQASLRVLAQHSAIAWALSAYVEPQIRRLAARLLEEIDAR
ncbi:MAG: hypothetical protein JWR33_818 [Naasia sp.]|jgi:hypothetical protein|uniref:hypothetical protein n=1 Tax=Naasia sp. TaxID=2546198 RepID=UPI0026364EAC|nr:hypothetical protein [Naasia sp.]MCU1570077.1 hypothetical protein [Naasia sp.]